MWDCTDERITYLRKYGYNVISLPRDGIRPLTVAFLQDNRRLTELGYLPEIWSSTSPEPAPMPDQDVAQIGGQSTDKLKADVGLDILSNLVQALGADPIGIKAQYSKASTLSFHFKEVARERITAFALGKYLTDGKLASDDPFVKRYFTSNEKIYVVTEVLKSTGFGVTADDSSSAGLALDIPVIQGAFSGKGSVDVESTAQGTVEFNGKMPLPFAFIAAQLAWNQNHWEVVDFPEPGKISMSISSPPPVVGGVVAHPWKGGSILFGNGAVDFAERPPKSTR
jgi:hypothetical protein